MGKYYVTNTGTKGFDGKKYILYPTEDEYFEALREEEQDDDRRVSSDAY